MVAPWVPSKKYKSGGALQHCPHHHTGRGSEDDTWIRFFTIVSFGKKDYKISGKHTFFALQATNLQGVSMYAPQGLLLRCSFRFSVQCHSCVDWDFGGAGCFASSPPQAPDFPKKPFRSCIDLREH